MSSMATRSAKNASGIGKKAPARKPRATRSTREVSDTWTLQTREELQTESTQGRESGREPHHYNGSLAIASREELDHDTEDNMSVHETIEPISQMARMAERVGREVETFAENLDKFLENLPTRNKFDSVVELVAEFKDIARDAALRVRKDHEQQRARQLRNDWSEQAATSTRTMPFTTVTKIWPRNSSSEAEVESVKEWRRWQQEADIWDLFGIVLSLHHNSNQRALQEDREEQLRALGPVHRYTTEEELWKHFILHDDLAKEREKVKTWLEQAAEHQESDLAGITEELESRATQGKGMWSQGWMDSREKIKAEKRLRSWPTTLGAPLPQIRTRTNELMATALDPDAPLRQQRTVEEEDAYFERAMWISCWEMLRRGKSWQEVSKWCAKNNESWRAISIGKASDSASATSKTAWRYMCYLASQAAHSNDWEAAVYGLLGGSVKAVQKVCRNVDDSLYAHYNAALIRQFEQYLTAKFPEHASRFRRPNDDALKDPQQRIVDLILKLRKEPRTSTESIQPMKMIQSYLLANDIGSMIHTMGFAIAYTDALRGKGEDMIVHLHPFWPEDANQPEAEIALDPQTLRIATHMSILLRELTREKLDGDERDAEENVTVAYIQALRAAGKRELIPLYASRLTVGRYVVTMGRVLEDVTTASEQEGMLTLLHNCNLDNILILNEQLAYLLNEYVAPGLRSPKPFKMLEGVDDTLLYPGKRIHNGFLPNSTTEEDLAIVRSLRWYNIITGYWKETFFNLSLALRKCLVAGRLACALSIVHEFPYENISIRKSYQVTGKSINPIDHEGSFPASEQASWELMIRQSKSYYELEHLVRAIKALAEWRAQEAEMTEKKAALLNISAPAPALRRAKENVDEAMSMVLTGRILQDSLDPDEASDLEFIRTHYIPEIIIAYNTVLHSAGSLISRENLIESMDLSVTVADDANGLAECFTAAERMRELVTSFAQTSKAMLILKSKKQWKPRKDKEGKDLGIWEVTVGYAEERNRDVSF